MSNAAAPSKGKNKVEVNVVQADQYQRKLHRVLRGAELERQDLSGGLSPFEPGRMSEQLKQATLSPSLVNPASISQDEGPLFQCTDCDMIVKESDPYCPFCGAIFADGPLAKGESDDVSGKPVQREQVVVPEMFDIFSMLRTRSRSKDLMYQEARKGFAGSARLLEEIEHLISDVSSLGTDTSRARRLIGSAWEACRDGDWNLAITLARQTEELMSPSIPDLVRSEIARAREHLTAAKAAGVEISDYVLKVKSAMAALHANDPDEALRLTKELMDSLREDSITWR